MTKRLALMIAALALAGCVRDTSPRGLAREAVAEAEQELVRLQEELKLFEARLAADEQRYRVERDEARVAHGRSYGGVQRIGLLRQGLDRHGEMRKRIFEQRREIEIQEERIRSLKARADALGK